MVRKRWAILGGLVGAAAITPTAGPFSFALVAGPILVLHEVIVIVVRVLQRWEALGSVTVGSY